MGLMLCSCFLALGLPLASPPAQADRVQAPAQAEADDLADLVGQEVVITLGTSALTIRGTVTKVGGQFITVTMLSRRAKDTTKRRTFVNRLHIVTIECIGRSEL
jgi:hypothetical protein